MDALPWRLLFADIRIVITYLSVQRVSIPLLLSPTQKELFSLLNSTVCSRVCVLDGNCHNGDNRDCSWG